MALQLILKDEVTTGSSKEILGGDVLYLEEGVTVARTDGGAANGVIVAQFVGMLNGANRFDIRGSVLGVANGILAGDLMEEDYNFQIDVAATGQIKSWNNRGIVVTGYESKVTNHGTIEGRTSGVQMSGSTGYTVSTVINTGTIKGDLNGIDRANGATERLEIHNTGTITGSSYGIVGSLNAVERVVNSGTIVGGVLLQGGDDYYDGRLGSLKGAVYGGTGKDTILGGIDGDRFYGNDGEDLLDGGAGDDELGGGAGVDILIGGAGDDLLDGGTDNDRMEGGAGNDTYYVDSNDDVIVELAGEGTDSVISYASSFVLSDNIERLTLGGSVDRDGTGNALANTLTGNTGKNTLKGMAGNDTLDGGTGIDRLEGGVGNDTYIVDNTGDVVVELAGEGTDTVKASASYTLSDNIERLALTGSGDIDGMGNALANSLTGNAGKNTLVGMDGNDTLDGGAGIDRLEGGAGNDTYVVDNAGDVIVELAGAGTETVKASASYTLSDNVERLVLTGSGNLNGTGNVSANILTGTVGVNVLKGMAGNDTLKGLDGNDTLDGGVGTDRMEGGIGNDTYVVDNAKDVVVELAGAGTDLVQASVSHVLAANVERLTLTGSGAINGTGNTLSNILIGNTGNNILNGGAGNDTLTGGKGADQLYGGAGKDMFVFTSTADSKGTAQDKIFDFSKAEGDRIDLRGIDANSTAADDQAFSFIGSSAFHKKAGELRFEQKSGDTFIHGDINGDGAADFSFVLDTVVNLKGGDFLL